jgi:DNA-binding MarR family transcriptional regulator
MAFKAAKPTQQQLEVYFFLVQYVAKHGHQPSQREIAEAFGVTQASIKDRLLRLEEHNLVEFAGTKNEARAIKLKRVRFRPEFDATMADTGRWMRSVLDEDCEN